MRVLLLRSHLYKLAPHGRRFRRHVDGAHVVEVWPCRDDGISSAERVAKEMPDEAEAAAGVEREKKARKSFLLMNRFNAANHGCPPIWWVYSMSREEYLDCLTAVGGPCRAVDPCDLEAYVSLKQSFKSVVLMSVASQTEYLRRLEFAKAVWRRNAQVRRAQEGGQEAEGRQEEEEGKFDQEGQSEGVQEQQRVRGAQEAAVEGRGVGTVAGNGQEWGRAARPHGEDQEAQQDGDL